MSPLRTVAVFFGASVALTAICQTPGILALRAGAQPSGVAMLLLAIGSCGPTLVAVAFSAAAGGPGGIRALFRRRGGAPVQFCAIALFHLLAAHLVGTAVLMLTGH